MTPLRVVALLLGVALAGALGFLGTSCVAHLYNDHLLIDAVRENSIRQQIQQQQQTPKPPQ